MNPCLRVGDHRRELGIVAGAAVLDQLLLDQVDVEWLRYAERPDFRKRVAALRRLHLRLSMAGQRETTQQKCGCPD